MELKIYTVGCSCRDCKSISSMPPNIDPKKCELCGTENKIIKVEDLKNG